MFKMHLWTLEEQKSCILISPCKEYKRNSITLEEIASVHTAHGLTVVFGEVWKHCFIEKLRNTMFDKKVNFVRDLL